MRSCEEQEENTTIKQHQLWSSVTADWCDSGGGQPVTNGRLLSFNCMN